MCYILKQIKISLNFGLNVFGTSVYIISIYITIKVYLPFIMNLSMLGFFFFFTIFSKSFTITGH